MTRTPLFARYKLHIRRRLKALIRRRGQTLVEYALILAIISVTAISVLISVGKTIKGVYSMINSQIEISASSH